MKDENQVLVNKFDFLIATATVPIDYPDSDTLFKSVIDDNESKYFLNNHDNHIRTFQDDEIIKSWEKGKKIAYQREVLKLC